MPKMRRASGHEVVRALEQMGFQQVRQRGSHVVMKRLTSGGTSVALFPCTTILLSEPCWAY